MHYSDLWSCNGATKQSGCHAEAEHRVKTPYAKQVGHYDKLGCGGREWGRGRTPDYKAPLHMHWTFEDFLLPHSPTAQTAENLVALQGLPDTPGELLRYINSPEYKAAQAASQSLVQSSYKVITPARTYHSLRGPDTCTVMPDKWQQLSAAHLAPFQSLILTAGSKHVLAEIPQPAAQ